MTRRAVARRAVTPWALSLALGAALLLLVSAALGPSAAEPFLDAGTGWRAALPPYTVGLHPSSGLVTVLVDGAYLVGGLAVGLGLWAVRRGEAVPRRALLVAVGVALLAVLVPPQGSADHVNYAAYGRIAAAGGDPYVEAPIDWAGGHDPVTSAVEPPWTTTPSIYGPVATAVQAATSLFGGDSLRATVWAWQLVCVAAWLAVGGILLAGVQSSPGTEILLFARRGARRGRWVAGTPVPSARHRAAWLWLLNPVLGGLLVGGAHVDILAMALGLGAVVLCARRPLLAGVLLGAAVGVKLTCALIGPAVLLALWRHDRRGWWRPALLGLLGAALVLVPAHLWAGPHVLDQLSRARRFVSLATPWRPLVDALTGPVPNATVRTGVVLLTPVAVVVVAVLVARLLRRSGVCPHTAIAPSEPLSAAGNRSQWRNAWRGRGGAGPAWQGRGGESRKAWQGRGGDGPAWQAAVTRDAALGSLVLGTAYVLAAPYSLPWYDALAWAPLGLVGASPLDALLLVRLVAYAVAYVPGRVIGMSEQVRAVTLGYRRDVTPWIGLAVLVALAWLACRRPRPGADQAVGRGLSEPGRSEPGRSEPGGAE